jgi:hypothetical protein
MIHYLIPPPIALGIQVDAIATFGSVFSPIDTPLAEANGHRLSPSLTEHMEWVTFS